MFNRRWQTGKVRLDFMNTRYNLWKISSKIHWMNSGMVCLSMCKSHFGMKLGIFNRRFSVALRMNVHRDLVNLQVEMLRQFQIQQVSNILLSFRPQLHDTGFVWGLQRCKMFLLLKPLIVMFIKPYFEVLNSPRNSKLGRCSAVNLVSFNCCLTVVIKENYVYYGWHGHYYSYAIKITTGRWEEGIVNDNPMEFRRAL